MRVATRAGEKNTTCSCFRPRLSHHSIGEARERKEQREVLFPVRLDKTVREIAEGWPASIRNTWSIGDFTRWKTLAHYQQAFARLPRAA